MMRLLDFVFIPLIFPSSKLKTKIIDQVNPELKDLFVLLVDVWVNGQDSIEIRTITIRIKRTSNQYRPGVKICNDCKSTNKRSINLVIVIIKHILIIIAISWVPLIVLLICLYCRDKCTRGRGSQQIAIFFSFYCYYRVFNGLLQFQEKNLFTMSERYNVKCNYWWSWPSMDGWMQVVQTNYLL